MNFLRIYSRMLGLLGPDARLGAMLAAANLALAVAQFAEPVLLGRIIDALIGGVANSPPRWGALLPLLAAWTAFGLFTIACGVNAGRLLHSCTRERPTP